MNVAGQQCMACYIITLLHKSEFVNSAYSKGLSQAQKPGHTGPKPGYSQAYRGLYL